VTREEMADRIAALKQKQGEESMALDAEHHQQRDRLSERHNLQFDALYVSFGGRRTIEDFPGRRTTTTTNSKGDSTNGTSP
jgi:hypothetical protein